MRYTKRAKPVLGDTKVVTKFLWCPVTIGNETRWLERATMELKCAQFNHYSPRGHIMCRAMWWRPERFLNT